jgi:alpha/beta superfamily hydrolase
LGAVPLAALAIFASGCTLDSFLFNPQRVESYRLPGNVIPLDLIEEVTFQSGGFTLHGIWVRSNGFRPGITILYCHGNKHNIDEYWDRVMLLHELGVNLFIFDYRGFGRSEGKSVSEEGLLADGEAALNYVLSRPEVIPDSVGYYGYSLGAVVAIYLAAARRDPLFLVAESPFASAASLAQGSLNLLLPAGWLTQGRFDNAERVKRIRTHFLLLHGSRDDLVRFRDNGRVVWENAPEPKRLVLVEGARHDDVPQTLGLDKYLSALALWINRAASAR